MKTFLLYIYILTICFLCFCSSYCIVYGMCVEDGIMMLIGAFLVGLAFFLSKLMRETFADEFIKLKEQIRKLANKYGTEKY